MRHSSIYIFCACLAVSTLGFAQLSERKTLIVGVDNTQYFPIYSSDLGLTYLGYSRELIKIFAEKYNYDITFRILPIERLYMEFWNGDVDLKYPDSPYWKSGLREGKGIHYTKSILDYVDGIVVKPENLGAGINNFHRLGLVRGFTPFALLGDIKARNITLTKNNTLTGMLRQVLSGRVDGAYINIDIARYQLREIFNEPGSLVFDPDLPFIKDSYLMSTLNHPGVIKEFNRFLVEEKLIISELKKQFGLKEWSN